ncbi:MAG: site-specific tyrosine recombinase XerD [Kiritimatiellae bacterium]|nr:site-specific tyrosine recombinase XerD [Kiritimatiellia bacterium]
MIDSEIELFLSALILEKGLSENTRSSYASDLKFFAEFLVLKEINAAKDVKLEDIVDFLTIQREEGMKSSTRARRIAAIRQFFGYLHSRKLIAENPTELMENHKESLILPKILAEEEVFKLLDSIDGKDIRDIRDRAILETLYGCGLRVSELIELKLEDFVMNGELLRIVGKGSKERIVPIGQASGRAITKYLEEARASFARGNLGETHVFLTRLGKKFTRMGVFKIIKQRAAEVDIAAERISPHVLRHCYASHMLSHGADIRAIQELLGHASISTTQIYTHVDQLKFSEIHRKYHPRA